MSVQYALLNLECSVEMIAQNYYSTIMNETEGSANVTHVKFSLEAVIFNHIKVLHAAFPKFFSFEHDSCGQWFVH